MPEDIAGIIRALPQGAFREPSNKLAGLTHLQKLRWLQQTAHFVWNHRGAACAGKQRRAPYPKLGRAGT